MCVCVCVCVQMNNLGNDVTFTSDRMWRGNVSLWRCSLCWQLSDVWRSTGLCWWDGRGVWWWWVWCCYVLGWCCEGGREETSRAFLLKRGRDGRGLVGILSRWVRGGRVFMYVSCFDTGKLMEGKAWKEVVRKGTHNTTLKLLNSLPINNVHHGSSGV